MLSSLYRKALRQARQLPDPYLQLFYRLKFADDIRAIQRASSRLQVHRIKRIDREIGKIKAGLNRDTKAFEHILGLAYGRKGKLRRELLEPLLTDHSLEPPPRIIQSVESSRPPVCPKALAALLTSTPSRERPLSRTSLVNPPTLPRQADVNSEEFRLLGPLSKRREVNHRWRYFTREVRKLRLPLAVDLDGQNDAAHQKLPLQDVPLLEGIRRITGPLQAESPPTRRRQNLSVGPSAPRHPSRWMRRRYAHLLGVIPLLKYSATSDKYSVTFHDGSITPQRCPNPLWLKEMDPVNQAWLNLADNKKP